MRVRVLSMMIIVILFFVGCEEELMSKKVENLPESDETVFEIDTYDDEAHKKISYGNLSFNLGSYHLVSSIERKTNTLYELEIDEGKKRPQSQMTIEIQKTEKREFNSKDSIVEYLSNIYSDYDRIKVYSDVVDDSGITDLYSVTLEEITYYLIYFSDDCYLLESDYSNLDIFLFENYPSVNLKVYNRLIECANDNRAYVKEVFSFDDTKAMFEINQDKSELKYFAELSLEGFQYNFTLINEQGVETLNLSTFAADINDIVNFLDVNMDGYLDIQFIELSGTLNNSYDLYVWDKSIDGFAKVESNEMISVFEVHEGYLLNWLKADVKSGIIQKLRWKGNSLIKESEEPYETD